jgi:hypothetical protein
MGRRLNRCCGCKTTAKFIDLSLSSRSGSGSLLNLSRKRDARGNKQNYSKNVRDGEKIISRSGL